MTSFRSALPQKESAVASGFVHNFLSGIFGTWSFSSIHQFEISGCALRLAVFHPNINVSDSRYLSLEYRWRKISMDLGA